MMISLVFLLVLVLVGSTIEQNRSGEFLSASLNKQKQSNWLNYAGKTYYFDNIFKANFFKSMQYCRQQGMHLVSISNKLENDRLGKFVTDNGITNGHFWTSAYNLGDEWVWLSTGNNVVFTNWYMGEPNGNSTENCIEMRFWGSNDFSWNDLNCYSEMFFICESTTDCKK